MTSFAHNRLKCAGTFCLVLLFFLCLAAEAKGQTLYEYKDESGAVVIRISPRQEGQVHQEIRIQTGESPPPRSGPGRERPGIEAARPGGHRSRLRGRPGKAEKRRASEIPGGREEQKG